MIPMRDSGAAEVVAGFRAAGYRDIGMSTTMRREIPKALTDHLGLGATLGNRAHARGHPLHAHLGCPTHGRQLDLALDQALAFENVVRWRHLQGAPRALLNLSKPAQGHRLSPDEAKRAPIEL